MAKVFLTKGIKTFIENKKIDPQEIYRWLLYNVTDKLEYNDNRDIINASKVIERNWDKFHNWINISLNNNTLRGVKVKTFNSKKYGKT